MSDTRAAVGRILFTDINGKPKFTAYYSMPAALREPELCTAHGVFRQNHVLPNGMYVYQYLRPTVGPSDLYLTHYLDPSMTDWDGPEKPPRKANWDDVRAGFDALAFHGCGPEELRALERLAYAAYHSLPVPGTGLPEPTSVTRQPPPQLRAPDKGHDFDGFILEEEN